MTGKAEARQFCKACGTPAREGELCEHCGKVLELSDRCGAVEDEGAAAQRVFEGRDG
ncbi:zinc-ribbon domain-containing protein [Streptomyces sp. NPDC002205]|uniref:YfgJ family double zinc ribbon protein n=1 Tax=Streptomyces sp. NPDC002205 TaxID=3154411 RepID=UPI0033230755